jgi:transcriptional regulator with XRE-family HTH domain
MTDLLEGTHPWDEAAYQRIVGAAGEGNEVSIEFENGDQVTFDIGRLIDVADNVPDWSALDARDFELEFPLGTEQVVLPWFQIRRLLDEDLAAHFARAAEREAEQVGHRLRILRERRGLSGRQLADRVGIAPQSLSRIERGRHDVVFSKVQQLLAAMDYSLSDLESTAEAGIDSGRISAALGEAGLGTETVRRILFCAPDAEAMLGRAKRIFGWSATDLAGPAPPPALAAASAGRFKELTRDSGPSSGPYADYVFWLAELIDAAVERPPYTGIPADPEDLAEAIRQQGGGVTLSAALDYFWANGIAIFPLQDRGEFHGACWLIGGRPVICLKQRTTFRARWLFDLLHEIYHVLNHLSEERTAIVEAEVIGDSHEQEEIDASDFATCAQLSSAHHELAERAVARAGGDIARLKRVLRDFAASEGVDVGALANYFARRLDDEGHGAGFWGVAANLQADERDALTLALAALSERLDWSRLDVEEQAVLRGALEKDSDGE